MSGGLANCCCLIRVVLLIPCHWLNVYEDQTMEASTAKAIVITAANPQNEERLEQLIYVNRWNCELNINLKNDVSKVGTMYAHVRRECKFITAYWTTTRLNVILWHDCIITLQAEIKTTVHSMTTYEFLTERRKNQNVAITEQWCILTWLE